MHNRQAVSHGRLQTGQGVAVPRSSAAARLRCHVVLIQGKMGMGGELMEERVAQLLHCALAEGHLHAALQKSWNWLDVNIIDLGRQMRVSYLPH